MSEQQEQQPVILTIDDQEYDVNELGNDSKIHYVEVVNLRKQISDLQNQIAAAHTDFRNNWAPPQEVQEAIRTNYAQEIMLSYLEDRVNDLEKDGTIK